MKLNGIELQILVRGRPITQYAHGWPEQIFVEGREGSEYEIEIRNTTAGRIEAVVSVDGLSVIDGKEAGSASTGYLLNPYETVRIPGWRLDGAQVAKFAFSGKQKSYATQMTGDARNNGVIGVMAFREARPILNYAPISYDMFRGLTPQNVPSWTTCSSTIAPSSADTTFVGASMNMPQNSLGTAFGEAVSFTTHQVTFSRGAAFATLIIRYDNKTGLKQRGIIVGRPKHRHEPQAFPAMGCVPPSGWVG